MQNKDFLISMSSQTTESLVYPFLHTWNRWDHEEPRYSDTD